LQAEYQLSRDPRFSIGSLYSADLAVEFPSNNEVFLLSEKREETTFRFTFYNAGKTEPRGRDFSIKSLLVFL
jgi:hypothetical protein